MTVLLFVYLIIGLFNHFFGEWCNGNTPDFGSARLKVQILAPQQDWKKRNKNGWFQLEIER